MRKKKRDWTRWDSETIAFDKFRQDAARRQIASSDFGRLRLNASENSNCGDETFLLYYFLKFY